MVTYRTLHIELASGERIIIHAEGEQIVIENEGTWRLRLSRPEAWELTEALDEIATAAGD